MAKGPHETALDRIAEPRERARYKARVLAGLGRSVSWSSSGVTFSATDIELVGDALHATIAASDAGGPLPLGATNGLPKANPFMFFNPPLKVPDGTTGPLTDMRGRTREAANFREAPLEALRRVVEDVVLVAARARGWSG